MNTFIHSQKLEDLLNKFSVKLVKTIYKTKFKNYWCEPIKKCTPGRGFEVVVWRPGIDIQTAHKNMDEQMNIPESCEEMNMPYFYYHTITDTHYYRFFMPAIDEKTLLDCFSDIEKFVSIL
jgi:hypothetical protein